jgi:hypothetical protein
MMAAPFETLRVLGSSVVPDAGTSGFAGAAAGSAWHLTETHSVDMGEPL